MTDFTWGPFSDFSSTAFGADSIEASHVETLGEASYYHIDIAPEIATGTADYIVVGESMRILIFNCVWNVPRTFHVMDNGWIRFNFSLDIDIDMEIGEMETQHMDIPSWRIIHLPEGSKSVENIPQGTATRWVTICFRADRLEELCGIKMENLPSPLGSLSGEIDDLGIYKSFELNTRLVALTADMMNTSLKGGIRLSYMLTKATELTLLALDYVINQPADEDVAVVLSCKDRGLIQKAHEYIKDNLAEALTVQKLSTMIGLNRNKLFYGFKSEYGMSISEYIQSLRLEEGFRLITETTDNILDISLSVGYQHQCNFSTAIKTRYGVTPSQLRAQSKK